MEAQSVKARQRSDFLLFFQAEPLHTPTSARPGEDCQIPTGVKNAVRIKRAVRMTNAVGMTKAVRINFIWKVLPLVAHS